MDERARGGKREAENVGTITGSSMTSPLVTLHVAAYTECLATTRLGALEGLLTSVRVAMDAQTAWAAESLVAGLADVPVLACWELVPRRRVEIVMVLP
jgi:hypothetical protein